MIGLEDRQCLSQDIDAAHAAGARLRLACQIAGIDLRTLQRWKAHEGLVSGDGRPQAVRPTPNHALSEIERARLLRVANEPRFSAVPPARIVPMLADEGLYLASESSFSRVLREHGQIAHRGRAKAPKAVRPPTTHIATAAREVWCWDMTYLVAQVMGRWFYLYLILDLYSRKIVGWEVHDSDHADHAAHLVRRTALAEGPRMPLAILRKQVRDLPSEFTLGDTMAMQSGMNLSSSPQVVVGARISKSANATPQPGDLQGLSPPVRNDAGGVTVVINTELR